MKTTDAGETMESDTMNAPETDGIEISPEYLYKMSRERTLAELRVVAEMQGAWSAPIRLTCDDCNDRHSCPCSADGYNVDGDCLMSK